MRKKQNINDRNLFFSLTFLLWISGILAAPIYGQNGNEITDFAGPFSSALENQNATAPDAAIPGFIHPQGRGYCDSSAVEPNNVPPYLNPVFSQWAQAVVNYVPAPGVYSQNQITNYVLGPAIGDIYHVISLGDISALQMMQGIAPGHITLYFAEPICDGPGPDFAVFENGFISSGAQGFPGEIFAELAYVDVSSDGVHFARFPAVSLTEPLKPQGGTGALGTIDPSNVYNLAGKHVNAYDQSWGTPFNLRDLHDDTLVLNQLVDLNNIHYIRLVDIPGNGSFEDNATAIIDPRTIDPNTALGGVAFTETHGIHEAWQTFPGTGGHDLEAVGAIQQLYGDANSDGRVDAHDFLTLQQHWHKHGYWAQGNFDETGLVDINDLLLLAANWLYHIDP